MLRKLKADVCSLELQLLLQCVSHQTLSSCWIWFFFLNHFLFNNDIISICRLSLIQWGWLWFIFSSKILWAPSSNSFPLSYPIFTLDNWQQVFSTKELNRRSTFGELYLLLLSPFRPFSYRTAVFVKEMAMAELYFFLDHKTRISQEFNISRFVKSWFMTFVMYTF